VAAASWLVVGAYGMHEATDTDGWLQSYGVFATALVVAVTLTVWTVTWSAPRPQRRRLHHAGVAVIGFAAVASLVAWALPLWMTAIAIGAALVAAASSHGDRAPYAALAAGPVVGMIALIVGVEAQVGRRDDYGDYPSAAGISLIVTAAIMIASLIVLARRDRAESTIAELGRPIAIER
jgi:hypothetical protein